jgi:hypothetical protein
MDFPYDPQELVVFSLIGVVCGLGKVGFIASKLQITGKDRLFLGIFKGAVTHNVIGHAQHQSL